MTVLSRVQNKLATKVFAKLGSTVGQEAWVSSVEDKWGDTTPTYASSVDITVVPYNLIKSAESFHSFGDLQSGEVDVVVPYDTTVSKKDRLTFKTVPYLVKEHEDYIILDGVAAYVIRLAKIL